MATIFPKDKDSPKTGIEQRDISDPKQATGFLSGAIQGLERKIGDVGTWTPTPNVNMPWNVDLNPDIPEVPEDETKKIIPPDVSQVEEDASIYNKWKDKAIRGFDSVFGYPQEIDDEIKIARANGATEEDISKIKLEYIINKRKTERNIQKLRPKDPLLETERFRNTGWAKQNRAPQYGEELYEEFMTAVRGRDERKERAKLKAEREENLNKLKTHSPVIGKNIIPIDGQDIDYRDKDKTYKWQYLSANGHTYTFKNMTQDEAFIQSKEIHEYTQYTGSEYYLRAMPELYSKARAFAAAGGDPYLFVQAARDFLPKEYNENLAKYTDSLAKKGFSQGTIEFLAGVHTFTHSFTTQGIPNYFYGLGPDGAKALDTILFPLDGIFMDAFVMFANARQDDEEAIASLLPDLKVFNDNVFYNPDGLILSGPDKDGFVNITADELKGMVSDRVDRNVYTGAMRSFIETTSTFLPIFVTGAVGAIRLTREIAKRAEDSLYAKKILKIKGRKATKDELFSEMKIIFAQDLANMKGRHKGKVANFLSNYIKRRQFYFGTQPLQYTKDVAFTFYGAELALELSDRYITQKLRTDNEEWWSDPTAAGIDFASIMFGGYAGGKLANTALQWPFKAATKTTEGALVVGQQLSGLGGAITTSFGVPDKGNPFRWAAIGFDKLLELVRSDTLDSIPNLSKAGKIQLTRLGKQLIKASDSDPRLMEGMRNAYQSTQRLAYEMRVPRDPVTGLALIDQDTFYKNIDSGYDNLIALNADGLPTNMTVSQVGGTSMFTQEEAAFTLGSFFEVKALKVVEESNIETINGLDNVKADAKYNFIKTTLDVRNSQDVIQAALSANLLKLKNFTEGKNNQTLNALAKSMHETLLELEKDTDTYRALVNEAVSLQLATILQENDFSDKMGTELIEILIKHQELKLTPEEIGVAKGLANTVTIARNSAILANKMADDVRVNLEKIQDKVPNNYIKYKNNFEMIEVSGGSIANETAEYVSKSGLVYSSNLYDSLRIGYGSQFEKALKNVPAKFSQVESLDLILGINSIVRANVGIPMFRAHIEGISETHLKPQLIQAYKDIAANEPIKEGQKRRSWKAIQSEILNDIAEERNIVVRSGNISVLDQIEEVRDIYGNEVTLNFSLPYAELVELRKEARVAIGSVEGTNMAKNLGDIRTSIDGALESQQSIMAANGYEDVVKNLIQANSDYELQYASRVRQSYVLSNLGNYTRLRKYTDESKLKNGKILLDLDDGRSILPRPKVFFEGSFSSGRLVSADTDLFFDDLMKKHTPDQLLNEFNVLFGEPKVMTVDGVAQTVFQTPKKGDPLYPFYKGFVKNFNTYLTARYASMLDDMEASGSTAFLNKVDKAKTDKDWKEILEQVPENYYAGALDSPEIRDFTGKVSILHQKTSGEIGNIGADWHKTVLKFTKSDKDAQAAVNNVLKLENKVIKRRLKDTTQTVTGIKQVLSEAKINDTAWSNLINSTNFFDKVITTQIVENGKVISPWLEAVKKSYLKKHGSDKGEDFDFIVSKLMADGIVSKYTVSAVNLANRGHPDMPASHKKYLETKGGTRGFGPMMTSFLDANRTTVPTKVDIDMDIGEALAIDGPAFYNALIDHGEILKTYMNSAMPQLQLIAKVSTVKQAPVDNMRIKPASYGLPNVTLNNAQSRINAVAQQRSSIKWPMTELAITLIKQREVKALSALMYASPEEVDMLAKMLLTGKVDKYHVSPAFGEFMAVEMFANSSEIAKAWYESYEPQGFVEQQIRTLFESNPTYRDSALYPFDNDIWMNDPFGGITMTNKGKEISDKREEYMQRLKENYLNQISDEEKLLLQKEFERAFELSQP